MTGPKICRGLGVVLAGMVGGAVVIPSSHDQALSQAVVGACRPVSERTSEAGCWILAHHSLGELRQPEVFWHVATYPSRAAAEAAKGPLGVVVESVGKVWLLTIADAGWRASGGEHVAEIGPLLVHAGRAYSAQYMEAVFTPGMTAPAHTHAGPEAWYTLAGETCLETPDGKQVGRAGGQHVIVSGGTTHAPHRHRH